jgi:hypothetical protein
VLRRRVHRAAWVPLVLVLSGASAEANSVRVGEREPLALAVLTPFGRMAVTSTSELLEALDGILRVETGLRPELVNDELLGDCGGRLACMTERVCELGDVRRAPRFLLVASVLAQGERDLLSLALLDLAAAQRARALEDAATVAADELVEQRILDSALVVPESRRELSRSGDARAALEELFLEQARPALGEVGVWRPHGTLSILGLRETLQLELDGHALGAVGPGPVELQELLPGMRRIELWAGGQRVHARSARVERGQTTLVRFDAARAADPGGASHRWTLLAAGAAAVAGAALIGATALDDPGPTLRCFEREDCGRRFVRIGDEPSALSRALPVAPFGLGLIGGGLVAGLGALIEDGGDEVPWISIAAGVGVGLATTALGLALEREPPTMPWAPR